MTHAKTTKTKTASPDIVWPPRSDALRLGRTIAGAFHTLPASQFLMPDPERRRRAYPAYFKLAVEDTMDHGTPYAVTDCTAVALWMPVPPEGLPAVELDGRLEQACDLAERDLAFHRALHARHPFERGAHHWLMILAVHPTQQGKGLGSRLLAAHHAYLDQQQLGVYSEAASMRARDFYRRLHGYADAGDPIQLPNKSLMYPMWREPQKPEPAR